jgi:hypothetical protein
MTEPTIRSRDLAALVTFHRARQRLRIRRIIAALRHRAGSGGALRQPPDPEVARRATLDQSVPPITLIAQPAGTHDRGSLSGAVLVTAPDKTGRVQSAAPVSQHPDVGNVAIVLAQANLDEGRRHPCRPTTRAKIARRLKGNTNGVGHVASAAARKRMRKGCRKRAQTDWIAHTTAANQSPAARRKNSEGVKAAWARRRAQEVRL